MTGADLPAETLVDELKVLRRGRGVQADEINRAAGPNLKRLAGVTSHDVDAEIRARIVDFLRRLTTTLQPDLRVSVEAALALIPEATGESLERRLEWAAAQIDRDKRTVIRRIDSAFKRMAQDALGTRTGTATEPQDAGGWYLEAFEAAVRLDGATPEALETRTVLVTAEELDEIVIETTIPRHPEDDLETHDLHMEVVHGGLLHLREQSSERNFAAVLKLPHKLHRNQRYTFQMVSRIPPGQPMHPHYVFVPRGRCDTFVLRVRFPLTKLPSRMWKLNAEPAWRIEDGEPGTESVRLNDFGEAHAEFENLRPGLGYGFKWSW